MKISPEIEADIYSYLKGKISLIEIRKKHNLTHWSFHKISNTILNFQQKKNF